MVIYIVCVSFAISTLFVVWRILEPFFIPAALLDRSNCTLAEKRAAARARAAEEQYASVAMRAADVCLARLCGQTPYSGDVDEIFSLTVKYVTSRQEYMATHPESRMRRDYTQELVTIAAEAMTIGRFTAAGTC